MRFDPFHLLIRPILTEKTNRISQDQKCYVFEVDPRATKTQIKAAIPLLFGEGVKVKKVNTMRVKGKVKRVRIQEGKRPDWKKAIVLLHKGERIDLY